MIINTTLSQSAEEKTPKYKYVIKQLLRLKAHLFYYIRYYTVTIYITKMTDILFI